MAKKKPAKKAAAAKKKPAKRTSTAKKGARKAAGKTPGKAARKAAPKTGKAAPQARKAAPQARKAAPKARKTAARPAAKKKETPPAPDATEPVTRSPLSEFRAIMGFRDGPEYVETTSAGIQPLAPEHAAVDELTSSGNELLDIFQKYDRNRTGSIEQREFARLLEALGQNISDEELAIAFDEVDTERTGKISWKQFKNWWTNR